ncbi:hypothetical protein COU96_00210 [Candidatus Shapirobacteria bacterium CG10_big_fil_rev_8_21_14_0_10_38_14]|uniref:DOD-type homing endonuclease domain-containing protein n=1 Tax=Candidatus Shapirobacteria bacterium CG10_big_fil_rev_8_21_14_0_10_38_14 TaxID=1974483 RepID=A0A2M8L6C2_9BACT|nr:MAG: hypothetical protein COU96_00210 [Candidatus Shapirobacteria bacterium CG10_big_fil_rev_8_21_14_0_10_38_14]
MKRKNFKDKNNPFYGEKHTNKSKRKIVLSHQGQVPWNKGKTGVYTEETLSKMRKPKTDEHKKKISRARLRKFEKITGGKIRKFEKDISENTKIKIAFGEILGTIPSDACFKKKDKRLYNYFLGSIDREFVKRLSNNFARLGIRARVLRRSSGLWYMQVCRRWLKAFLPYLEKKNNKWIFSNRVLDSSDKEFKAAIIRSFSDADGTVTYTIKNGKYYSRHISIYNSVRELLLQIKGILYSFGILSRIYLNRNERKDKIGNQFFEFSATYSLSITNYKNLKLFYDSVSFGITRKMRKLKKLICSYKCIERQYAVEDYRKALFLYKRVENCREVSRRLNIPPQTVQNWVLHNVKPRLVKIHLKEKVI